MARNREDSRSICHYDVCTLAKNVKAGLFQRGNGFQMVDPGQFGHRLTSAVLNHFEILNGLHVITVRPKRSNGKMDVATLLSLGNPNQ